MQRLRGVIRPCILQTRFCAYLNPHVQCGRQLSYASCNLNGLTTPAVLPTLRRLLSQEMASTEAKPDVDKSELNGQKEEKAGKGSNREQGKVQYSPRLVHTDTYIGRTIYVHRGEVGSAFSKLNTLMRASKITVMHRMQKRYEKPTLMRRRKRREKAKRDFDLAVRTLVRKVKLLKKRGL